MASMGYEAGRGQFSVGDTLQATWDAVSKNFVTMIVPALLLVGGPRLLLTLLFPPALSYGAGAGMNAMSRAFMSSAAGAGLLGFLVYLVGSVLLEAAVTQASVLYLNGRRPDIAGCLRGAFRIILPLIGIVVLTGLGVFLGFLFFIIPGAVLAIMWTVAVPAEVMEGVGVLGAFSRSRELTRGRRWAIFGFLFVLWVLSIIIYIAVGMVIAAIVLSFDGGPGTAPYLVVQVVNLLVTSLLAVVNAAGTAAVYVALRRIKDGATPSSLASVFD